MDIYSVGEMVIDFIPGKEPQSYVRHAGGGPANVAISAARNGLEAGFCGKVGNDDFGHFLISVLEENHVKVLCPHVTDEAVTTMAFVSLRSDGERSFTFARKPGADMFLRTEDIREQDIRNSTIIHGGSCSLSKGPAAEATKQAFIQGHAMGKLVSFDINYRALIWDGDKNAATNAVLDILPYIDLLKISEEEIDMVGGITEIPNLMAINKIAVVVETLGAKGVRCWFKDALLNAPCPKVHTVDTTGAGDAFWGTFLSSLIRQGINNTNGLQPDIIKRALWEGNIAGTLCVQKKGAIESLPVRNEIEIYLAHYETFFQQNSQWSPL